MTYRDLILDEVTVETMVDNEIETTIKKGGRFLLLGNKLSLRAQDIFAICLLRINKQFNDRFYGHINPNYDDQLEFSKNEILNNIDECFTLDCDEISNLTSLSLKVLKKKSKLDNGQDWDFEFDKAAKELHKIFFENWTVDSKGNKKRETSPLLVKSSFDGKVFKGEMNKNVAYEMLRLNYNNVGYSSVPKSIFFKQKSESSKKILELICRFKNFKDYEINLWDYLNEFGVDMDEYSDSKNRQYIMQKYLYRSVASLISNSNGYVSLKDEEKYPQGYELVGLGRFSSINDKTKLVFKLKINENYKMDCFDEIMDLPDLEPTKESVSLELFNVLKDALSDTKKLNNLPKEKLYSNENCKLLLENLPFLISKGCVIDNAMMALILPMIK